MKKLILIASVSLLGTLPLALAQNRPAAGDPFVKDAGTVSPGASVVPEAVGASAAEENTPWQNCLLIFEAYALDKSDALALLESAAGSSARYRGVTELAKVGKARLVQLTALTSKSGNRGSTESIDEVRYPIEFSRPTGKGALASPTSFETRNAGESLEFDVTRSADGRACDLNFSPRRVNLMGFFELGAMHGDSPVSQPHFRSQTFTTNITFPVNVPHYAGSLTPPTGRGAANGGEASELWLTFVRVNSVAPSPAERKLAAGHADWSALNLEYRIYSAERAAAREILLANAGLTAPWEKLKMLTGEKKARLEHLVSIQGKSGIRSAAEEVEEVRYAVEYDPAGLQTTKETTQSTATTTPVETKSETPSPKPNDKAKALPPGSVTKGTTTVIRDLPNAPMIPGVPSAFETRSAGISIQVEPVVGEDRVIDLMHELKSVMLSGNLKVDGVAAQYPAQPLFETRSIAASQAILAGPHQLVGTFNPPGADGVNDRADSGRTWLVFIRATPNEP